MKVLLECGPALADIRRNLDIKAAPVARHIGVSESTLSRIEHGITRISMERCMAICEELKYSFDRLMEKIAPWALRRPQVSLSPVVVCDSVTPPPPEYKPDSVLDSKQVAAYLKISVRTLARRVKKGLIEAFKSARNVRYLFSNIQKYLENNKKKN